MKKVKPFFFSVLFLLITGIAVGGAALFKANSFAWLTATNSTNHTILPLADFSFDENIQCSYQAISFTNSSTGEDLEYSWDFGDPNSNENNFSSEENPTHIFIGTPGTGTETFTVSLTTTNPEGVEETISKDITLNQSPSLTVTSDRSGTDFDELQYLVVCESSESEFTFYNNSTTLSTNVSYELDWGDGSEVFIGSDWTELSHTYPVGIYTITYSVTGDNGCTASKEYGIFVGSNPAVGLGNPGNTNVCGGETLSFPITGTENNPAGTQYIVNYSDGSPEEIYNHPPPPSVTHTFDQSSCGVNGGDFPNSYSVKIIAENPCSASSAVVSPIYVSESPQPQFGSPEDPVCVGTPERIWNLTEFGGEVSNNGACTDFGKFVWEISPQTGWILSTGVMGTQPNPNAPSSWTNGSGEIYPQFSEPGTYNITLKTGNRCGVNEISKTVCVVEQPQMDFETDIQEGCGPITVNTTNSSILDESCGQTAPFIWSVQYNTEHCGTGGNWTFAEGSEQNSENPGFIFNEPGQYIITLSTSTTCGIFSQTKEINVYAPPTLSLAEVPNLCEPATINPEAIINICNPGEANYLWTIEGGNPATSTEVSPGGITFETPGEKSITLEVSTDCGTVTETVDFTLSGPPEIDAGENSTICNGESSELSANVPENGDFSFQWTSSGGDLISPSDISNPSVSPSETTTYTLLVTDNNTGCFSEDNVTIDVDPAPVITFSMPDQSICSGETTAPVTLSSGDGTTMEWTADFGEVTGGVDSGDDEIPAQTLNNPTNSPIDVTYTAVITSSEQGACAVQPVTYTITVNPVPEPDNSETEICNGEALSYQHPNYIEGTLYNWTIINAAQIDGATNQSESQPFFSQTLVNTSNEPAVATYEVTPILGNCSGDPFQLEVTVLPSASIGFSQPNQVICSGGKTKEVSISSNIPDATFSWTAEAIGVEGVITSGNSNTIPEQELVNPTHQALDVTYTILSSAESQGDCASNGSTYTITVNPFITINSTISDYSGFEISCSGANDGFIEIDASGGNGNFTYNWTGPNGFTASSFQVDNLTAGIYNLSIEDPSGCFYSETFDLEEPPGLHLELDELSQILCSGEATGSISINVIGGNPSLPTIFEWQKDGEPYSSDSQNLVGIPAGSYELIAYNGENCPAQLGPITITEPETPLLINYFKSDISCYNANDGTIDLDISGGVPPYQISWGFGSSQTSFDNLGPGTYTVAVTDREGCIKSEEIIIEDASLFQVDPEVNHISCSGMQDGSIELNLQEDGQEYTIRWDHGAETEDLFNLVPGSYGVTITLDDGCQIREEFNLIEPALLTVQPEINDALDCSEPQSGSVNLVISGGRPPYDIQWEHGPTSPILSSLTEGIYQVSIEDASGCLITEEIEIKSPEPVTVVHTRNTMISCNPQDIREEFEIFISGGMPPYDINWSAGEISNDGRIMATSQAGLYSLNISDARGCTYSESFEVNHVRTVVNATVSSEAFVHYNTHLVNFELEFQNNSTGDIIEVFWDFGDGTTSNEDNPKHTFSQRGNYSVLLKVTDSFGCTSETQLEVEVLDHFLVVPNVFTPNNDGINDHFFPKFKMVESLEFWVINKWGETVFYTNKLESEGWDGKIKNEPAPSGNYVYKLVYSTLDDRRKTQTEVFMLLK